MIEMAVVNRKLYNDMARTTLPVTGAPHSIESYFRAMEGNIREVIEDAVSRYR